MNNENTTARPWHTVGADVASTEPEHDGYGGVQPVQVKLAEFGSEEDATLAVKAVNAYDALKAKADMLDEFITLLDEERSMLEREGLVSIEIYDLTVEGILLEKAKELTDNE